MRDTGIDFIFIDVTNHAYVGSGSDRTREMILDPFDRLLAVWSAVPDAPQVVPWVPIEAAGTDPSVYTVDALLDRLSDYPGMHFEYLGLPLILVTDNEMHPVNAAKFAELELSYTLRRMWGALPDDGPMWSFLQRCDDTPAEDRLCRQRLSTFDGVVEQIPISAAYQASFMSDTSSATPKLRGLTFRRQFHTLMQNPEVPIATITGWNEWVSGRRACDSHALCPCTEHPNGCFTDQYDLEYSRDIEPGLNEMGDYYYRLMSACIELFRAGGICDGSRSDHLCCAAWTP